MNDGLTDGDATRKEGGNALAASETRIVRAITEQNQADDLFRLIVESAPNAIVMVNAEGHIVLVNARTEKSFGYDREDLVGRSVEILVPEHFRVRHTGYRAGFFASPQTRPMGVGRDLFGLRKDGSEFPVEIGLNPIRTREGGLVLAAIVDITERKRAEEARASLAAIVESSEDAIISKKLDGTIMSWNHAAERLYGYTAEEVVGKPLSILLPTERADELTEIIDRLKRGERISHYETVRLRKDGSRVDVSLTISAVKNEGGQIIGASKIARDITERKQIEKDLRESKENLERAVAELQAKGDEVRAATQQLWQAAKLASVGELAASIAHELNNPLATISLRIESAVRRTPADDPRRRALEIIEQETKRMGELVANLLQFSRRGEEKISTLDICEELTKAVELVQHHLRKRRVTVVQELAPDTPTIHADRQKLRQVFLNLLTNAGDAMPQGGTLTLRSAPAALEDGRPAVRIDFVDTGVGIPAEQVERVFDPFFTTKEEGQGTGLGLAICRRAVEDHHGTIQILSEVGKGTTVRMVLPVKNGANVERIRGTGLAE